MEVRVDIARSGAAEYEPSDLLGKEMNQYDFEHCHCKRDAIGSFLMYPNMKFDLFFTRYHEFKITLCQEIEIRAITYILTNTIRQLQL